MKKWICFVLLLLIPVLTGCSGTSKIAVSVLAGSNVDNVADIPDNEASSAEYIGRVGVETNGTEIGFGSHYWNTNTEDHQTYGIYAIQYLVEEPNQPDLFSNVIGRPYITGQASLGLDADGDMWGIGVGTSHIMGGIEILTEFQVRSYDDALKKLNGEDVDKYKLFIGPRFRF